MGWFGKDWNVIAIIFETRELYRVNGQRGKGGDATKCRDGAKTHDRTIYWAVFDQKRKFVEDGMGNGARLLPNDVILKLKKEFSTNASVTSVLSVLERGEKTKESKGLVFSGYPKAEQGPEDE
jgi:hypothetical protein